MIWKLNYYKDLDNNTYEVHEIFIIFKHKLPLPSNQENDRNNEIPYSA